MKLIVEMEMPVKEWNCLDCKAICADLMRGHYCGITKKTIDTLKNMRARPDWCPILGVLPERHGDLIDRDEAFYDIKRLICNGCNWRETEDDCAACITNGIEDILCHIKPIIAAERSET